MIYLLDKHVFLWAIIDPKSLSEKTISVIENNENTIFISAIGVWEISLKCALGKLNLFGLKPNELIKQAKDLGFDLMPVSPESAASHYKLNAAWHRDPFDRMLIWQAIQKDIALISKDENISKYQSAGLKVIWGVLATFLLLLVTASYILVNCLNRLIDSKRETLNSKLTLDFFLQKSIIFRPKSHI